MKGLITTLMVVGGVVAAGYVALRLMDDEQKDKLRDRAIDLGLDAASEAAKVVEDIGTRAQDKLGGGDVDVTEMDQSPKPAATT